MAKSDAMFIYGDDFDAILQLLEEENVIEEPLNEAVSYVSFVIEKYSNRILF